MRNETAITLFICLTLAFCACKSPSNTVKEKSPDDPQNVELPEVSATKGEIDQQFIDSTYQYEDSTGIKLTIRNGLPKGGHRYTAPNGNVYSYAIFWTQIVNDSGHPIDLRVYFPQDSVELTSTPENYLKLMLPSDPMTPDKVALSNYGLEDLAGTLDKGLNKSSQIEKAINSKESYIFYVIALTTRGVDGVIRAGITIREQDIIYAINGLRLRCGSIKQGKQLTN